MTGSTYGLVANRSENNGEHHGLLILSVPRRLWMDNKCTTYSGLIVHKMRWRSLMLLIFSPASCVSDTMYLALANPLLILRYIRPRF
jgi:hypothetical protein